MSSVIDTGDTSSRWPRGLSNQLIRAHIRCFVSEPRKLNSRIFGGQTKKMPPARSVGRPGWVLSYLYIILKSVTNTIIWFFILYPLHSSLYHRYFKYNHIASMEEKISINQISHQSGNHTSNNIVEIPPRVVYSYVSALFPQFGYHQTKHDWMCKA